jgi:hypothetical protein
MFGAEGDGHCTAAEMVVLGRGVALPGVRRGARDGRAGAGVGAERSPPDGTERRVRVTGDVRLALVALGAGVSQRFAADLADRVGPDVAIVAISVAQARIDGRSRARAADELDVSLSTVERRLRKARAA